MKVYVLLVCVWLLCWRTEAQSRTYLISAPLSFRLDALETVVVQLFGFTDEVTVHVFLKTSMAPNHKVLAREVVTLNAQNNHQADAKVRLYPNQLDKSVTDVILHVQSDVINQHQSVPISRTNGFLFIQTDKPLYTPLQSVKVRAFSLNQELRPANRSVFLTFKDPDRTTVDIVEMVDVNNGIPSLQNPFKIPINPKLGIWSIEASYSDDFTTTATTDFEVREYVLPSFSILVEPEANYISYNFFTDFNFKVSARYLHGAPVADGEVLLRYGYVSGINPPVIIPNSVTRQSLSSSGEVNVNVNMQKILSRYDGPKDLSSLTGKYLYIAVMVEENKGGIIQETEFAAVKFVKSPYSLSLVSTPPFIKPGLPYNIQVLVKDHLDKPVKQIQVSLVERQLFRQGRDPEDMPCNDNSNSGSNGLTFFICNTPSDGVRAVLKFQTKDPRLPAASQSSLTLTPVAYYSPNQRYLYIDTPLTGPGLQVGQPASLSVYSATPAYIPIRTISYLVISKGKVVDFGSEKFLSTGDNKQRLSFHVTPAMVPSIRVLVYYILFGEGTSELVADSVWLDVKDKCVNGLQTDMSLRKLHYKPKENLQLNVRTRQDGLVALSAVDSAIFTLRPNYQDPVSMVLRHIEQSDLGCGGGGGKDSADVFGRAGLTFITNANAAPSTTYGPCTAVVRAKRALTEEEKKQIVENYANAFKKCCEYGLKRAPTYTTCLDEAEMFVHKNKISPNNPRPRQRCKQAFQECCEALLKSLANESVIARNEIGADFDLAPSLVRSYFPESWMWEVQRISSGRLLVSRPLPDSLTTWQIKAVGMFQNGMCVADPVQVSVNLLVSVDIPLPYQVVRGEQLELTGSVYNQQLDSIRFCVTLKVGPAICLLKSEPVAREPGFQSTVCTWQSLPGRQLASVTFTLLGLEPGEHTLTFSLRIQQRTTDILEKKLRVVPEGVRQEVSSGGRLDPQGVYEEFVASTGLSVSYKQPYKHTFQLVWTNYVDLSSTGLSTSCTMSVCISIGSEKRTVELKNQVPVNIVPNTGVERMLTINGEVLGEVLSVAHSPEGFRQLINLPSGSAEAELGGLLPLIQLYQYLESSGSWNVLGDNIQKSAANMKQKIREGLVSISSYRLGDSSYSMWRERESSIWLTALVVRALSAADSVVSVSHQTLSESVTWLMFSAQKPDGSFREESPYKSNKILAEGTDAVDQSVYLTSFVLIALLKATKIRDPILQLQIHDDSINSAVTYISQHAMNVKSVYVRAVATYALTLHDSNSMISFDLISSLEKLARQKGNPVVLRYWQEASVTSDWLKPDQSSGVTVEITAYVLLTMLLKGRLPYVKPVLSWLTQDQHYGEGFYSVQDTFLTLEALTEYSKLVSRAAVDQDISIRYRTKGILGQVHISQNRPVASPLEVTKNDNIIVSTGYGRGVSNVKMKTVYYQTVASTQLSCNFDLTVDVATPNTNQRLQTPTLVVCVKYKPPPNEVWTESTLTVMKIQLPTGVDVYLEDLKQFTDPMQPIISHYELQGNTVIIQMDSVPSNFFLCMGFRLRTAFKVTGATKSLLTVSEVQDKGSLCTKEFTYERQLQRLCLGQQCQCMTAACATYRGDVDVTLTADKRTNETCQPHIKYAYKVTVTSSAAEGDFMAYTATVDEVIKSTNKDLEGVRAGTVVDLVKKATCNDIDIQNNKQYLLMGASGSEVTLENSFKYRLPLDSEAVVELWPADCSSPECLDYISQLEDFALNLQLAACS